MRKFLAAIFFLCLTAGARAACPYTPPITWYWAVQDNSPSTQVWNGNTGAYVVLADATYVAWLAAGCLPTSIDTAANLQSTINSYASGIGRAPYQSYSSGAASVQMTNPVANYVNAALTNATPVLVLPKQNLPTSIGIGQQTLIAASGGFDITVKAVDGTTTIYTIKDGETASLVPVANDSQNGTWATYTLPRVTPTNATNITAGTLAAARMAAFGSGDVSFASGGGAGTIATAQPGAHTWAAVQTFTSAPVFTDQSGSRTALGLATVASSASAADLSAGTLLAARMPALTGDVTTSAGSVATTLASSAAVKSFNGQTGVVALLAPPQGRLTLTSGTPVMTSSVTGGTTVYYTAYVGEYVPIYNGTNMVMNAICAANTAGACEQSVVLGANWTLNTNYDFFDGFNGGAATLCSGPAWSSATARGTGAGTTELQQFNGVWTNKVSMTCRSSNTTTFTCAVNSCTYLGSVRTTAAGQVDFIFGTFAAGGGGSILNVWNQYNSVLVTTIVADSTVYNYSSATVRAADASNNNRVTFLSGMANDAITATYSGLIVPAASTSAIPMIAIGLDSTTTTDKRAAKQSETATSAAVSLTLTHSYAPQLGSHFIQALEGELGAVNSQFNTTANNYGGLVVNIRM
jgi:hypothetical protein